MILLLIPLHTPHFKYAEQFLRSFHACKPRERGTTRVAFIFSETSHAESFRDAVESVLVNLFTSIIIDAPLWEGQDVEVSANVTAPLNGTAAQHVVVWKRWMGLAMLADTGELHTYSHVVLLDAELRVGSCHRLALLLPLIRTHEDRRSWPTARTTRNSNRAVTIASGHQVAASPAALAKLTTAFKQYAWWTDLPYVRTATVLAILNHWRQRPSLVWPYARELSTNGKPAAGREHQLAVRAFRPGHGLRQGKSFGFAFAHMTCLLWRVLHEGLSLATPEALKPHEPLLEGLPISWLEAAERLSVHVLERVNPLWAPQGAYLRAVQMNRTAYEPVFLFHVDRHG